MTRRLAALVALALLLRAAYAMWSRPPFDGVYWALADGLLTRGSLSIGGQPTTDFEPLYPMFLALCRLAVGASQLRVQALQIAVAAAGVILMYRLTATLTQNARAATLSAALFALDPLLIRQAVQHSEAALTTTLLLAFSILFLRAATTPAAAVAGAALGFAILARAMLVPLIVGGASIWLLQRRYRSALVFTIAALAVIAPFAARNAALNGSWAPTRSGGNLFMANHPYAAALLPDYDLDLLAQYAYDVVREGVPPQAEGADYDRAADRLLTRRALAYMAAAPWQTAMQKLRNVWYFLSPRLVPYRIGGTAVTVTPDGRVVVEGSEARPRLEHVVSMSFYSLVLAFAIAGVYLHRRRLRTEALLWCIVATFVVVYSIYVPATRYRGPMSFVLIYYAAVALSRVQGPGLRPNISSR